MFISLKENLFSTNRWHKLITYKSNYIVNYITILKKVNLLLHALGFFAFKVYLDFESTLYSSDEMKQKLWQA